MRKLLFTLLFLASISANALNLAIEKCSYSDSVAITAGSEQWFDIRSSGQYTGSDKIVLTLYHVNENGKRSDTLEFYNQRYYLVMEETPFNPDGTKRVKFNIPATYKTGKFIIRISQSLNERFGILASVLSIPTFQEITEEETKPIYFDLKGVQVEPITPGIYIKKVGNNTEKIFISDRY